jgi:hypothetical protein
MKKKFTAGWKAIGDTGKILLFCFLLYFISKSLGKH